jgi:hypothetical protein
VLALVSQVRSKILATLLWVSVFDLRMHKLVYGLWRYRTDPILLHSSGDLLRRPPELQVLDDVRSDGIGFETWPTRAQLSLRDGPLVREAWRVPSLIPWDVLVDFPRD